MHLSEFLLDWSVGQNPYKMHKHLWKAFPDMPESGRPFLFRFSEGKRGEPFRILMQSTIPPQCSAIPQGCSLLRTKDFNPLFRKGQSLRFLVRANPTKRLNQARCRVPLIDEMELIDWLSGKMSEGAKLKEAQIHSKKILYFRKGGTPGKIVMLTFYGLLSVESPEGLIKLLEKGIGPAKCFGCGLISLARL